MPTQRTDRLALPYPEKYDANWHLLWRSAVEAVDGVAAAGGLAVTPASLDAATGLPNTLTYAVAPGSYRRPDRSVGTSPGTSVTGPLTLPASALTYVWLDASGAVASGPAYPTTGPFVPLAAATTDGTKIVPPVADQRVAYDASAPALTAPASATAAGTYGATEQAMLQAVYDLVRKMVLGA